MSVFFFVTVPVCPHAGGILLMWAGTPYLHVWLCVCIRDQGGKVGTSLFTFTLFWLHKKTELDFMCSVFDCVCVCVSGNK